MQQKFEAVPDPRLGVLYLCGELDMDDVGAFRDALEQLLGAEPDCFRIDLSQLTYLGSAGLACLIDARQRRPDLVLCGVGQHRRLFEITQVADSFRFDVA